MYLKNYIATTLEEFKEFDFISAHFYDYEEKKFIATIHYDNKYLLYDINEYKETTLNDIYKLAEKIFNQGGTVLIGYK